MGHASTGHPSAAAAAAVSVESEPEPGDQQEPERPTPEAAGSGPELTFERASELWPQVVESLTVESPVLSAILTQAAPVGCEGRTVTIAFPTTADFHRRKAQDHGYRVCVMDAFFDLSESRVEVEYILSDDVEVAGPAAEKTLEPDEVVDILAAEFGGIEIDASATVEPADRS